MTIDERYNEIERGMDRLRRGNRVLLIAVFLGAGVIVSPAIIRIFASQEQTAEVISQLRAKRFILEDESGQTRIEIGMLKDEPALRFLSENGKTLAMLSVAKDNAGLSVIDEKGNTRVILGLSQGSSLLGMSDEKGQMRVGLSVARSGCGIALWDNNQKARAEMIYLEDGPILRISDERGKTIWSATR